jgi:putative transcriptional regulator
MSSLQGHFLVAAPQRADPNLVETVVLVVEHTNQGAFGVVMNSSSKPGDGAPAEEDYRADAAAGFGGPVTGPLMAIHTEKYLAETKVLPGVFFSAKEENVLLLMEQTDEPYKVFTGYVEWGKGQLDADVRQGLWRIVAATAEQIFSDGKDLWQRLSKQAVPVQFLDLFDPKYTCVNALCN